jgi:molybdopterin synthase catalytic subunit
MRVLVQAEDFSPGDEIEALQRLPGVGGVGSFLGIVRSTVESPIEALVLEHYPAMTLPALRRIAAEAAARFSLLGCTVIHRHGRLLPGERIVLVVAAAAHRQAALDATGFLIDWLKTSAPFWKQEILPGGEARWVDARSADDEAAAKWHAGNWWPGRRSGRKAQGGPT